MVSQHLKVAIASCGDEAPFALGEYKTMTRPQQLSAKGLLSNACYIKAFGACGTQLRFHFLTLVKAIEMLCKTEKNVNTGSYGDNAYARAIATQFTVLLAHARTLVVDKTRLDTILEQLPQKNRKLELQALAQYIATTLGQKIEKRFLARRASEESAADDISEMADEKARIPLSGVRGRLKAQKIISRII